MPEEANQVNGKKKVLIITLVLLLIVAAALCWVLMSYHVVGFRLYPKQATALDLRGQEISVEDYMTLREKMPQTQIRWDIPFQGGILADDAEEVTVTSLTEEDVLVLDHLTQLKTVDAQQCTDYEALLALQKRRPEVQVQYYVHLSGEGFYQGSNRVEVDSITAEEIGLLQYLTELSQVVVVGGENTQNMAQLQEYCNQKGIEFCIQAGGNVLPDSTREVTVSAITDDELNLVQFLTNLEQLHLKNPQASSENLRALQASYPQGTVTWEVEIGGLSFLDTDTEVDLSAVVIEDLAAVEAQMEYLPNAQTLIFGLCGIDNEKWGNSKSKLAASAIENEDMAAYRDRVREDYKVVWTVRLGPSIALRTDADNFMPNHFGVGILTNEYSYNLRYCEEMVCLDVGHMTLTDISFVEYMPNLKYLILAWTEVQYIEPIRTCKNLIWLELDNSCIRDYSPLVDCTALEDLNIGNTFCDITPILEMTWLKNLYMIMGNGGSAWKASQALPDTRVVATGDATVGGGWRRLPNYYDMRDCLGMYYMN